VTPQTGCHAAECRSGLLAPALAPRSLVQGRSSQPGQRVHPHLATCNSQTQPQGVAPPALAHLPECVSAAQYKDTIKHQNSQIYQQHVNPTPVVTFPFYLLSVQGIFVAGFDYGTQEVVDENQAVLGRSSHLHYAHKVPENQHTKHVNKRTKLTSSLKITFLEAMRSGTLPQLSVRHRHAVAGGELRKQPQPGPFQPQVATLELLHSHGHFQDNVIRSRLPHRTPLQQHHMQNVSTSMQIQDSSECRQQD
jgi:hypothetical protein